MSRRQNPSISTEVQELAATVFEDLNGRATSREIQSRVRDLLSEEQRDRLADRALAPIVSGYFLRRHSSGLPHAPEVNKDGTHCQLQLMTVDEGRYVIRNYMRQSRTLADMAYLTAKWVHALHGEWIDPVVVSAEQTGT